MYAFVVVLAAMVLCAAGCGPSGAAASGTGEAGLAGGRASSAGAATPITEAAAPEPLSAARAGAAAFDDPPSPAGDAARGRELVAKLECARCHDGAGVAATPISKHCVHCHQDVLDGKLGAANPEAPRWREHVAHLRDVPSLAAIGKRFRRGWVEGFVLAPHDLRPALAMSMPRLAMTAEQARDIATYLVPDDAPGDGQEVAGASVERGRALWAANGCAGCHAFTGVPAPEGGAGAAAEVKATSGALALAPDLRVTRERYRSATLVAWLLDPRSVKPDAVMPKLGLTVEQARDLAAYVLRTPLTPVAARAIPKRLPVLDRRVGYAEVRERVLGVTCVHCHSEPKTAIGDGGPGNGGGFGFAPRKMDVGSYSGISAGFVGDDGERQSVFAKTADGTPWLVAALMARHAEEAGRTDPRVRGMPLGLPALPIEDIQLVESWIAQGRPQ